MNKEKRLGLSPRRYKKNEEACEEIYDDEIRASDCVGRDNIQIQFWTPQGKRQMGEAVRWHPRKKTLDVKLLFMDRVFEIEKIQCACAYRTEMPSNSKLPSKTVVRVGKDGKEKKVPNPLWRLKVLEITKQDRDKLRVIWE